MDFQLTADQKMLADTVASFVRKESPIERARKLIDGDDPRGFDPAVWKQMGELGWLAVPFSEEAGGFGGSFIEASLILERFGKTLVPEPYLSSVVLAGNAIARAGSAAQRERWLEPMLAGDKTLALAYAEEGRRYSMVGDTTARRDGDRLILRGRKVWVLGGHAADALVVTARTDDGPALVLVDAGADHCRVTRVNSFDGRGAAIVSLEDVAVGADQLLGEPGGATERLLSELFDLGAAACCAEAVGVMQTVLDMTVEYLKTREQFGVKIGTFQALQHRAVDMFVETELARSAAMMASIKVAQEPDPTLRAEAVSAAKAQVHESGKYVSQQGIQLLGGIGITHEHDIGLYFKRMHTLNTLFGDEVYHLRRFGRLDTFTRGVEGGDYAAA